MLLSTTCQDEHFLLYFRINSNWCCTTFTRVRKWYWILKLCLNYQRVLGEFRKLCSKASANTSKHAFCSGMRWIFVYIPILCSVRSRDWWRQKNELKSHGENYFYLLKVEPSFGADRRSQEYCSWRIESQNFKRKCPKLSWNPFLDPMPMSL